MNGDFCCFGLSVLLAKAFAVYICMTFASGFNSDSWRAAATEITDIWVVAIVEAPSLFLRLVHVQPKVVRAARFVSFSFFFQNIFYFMQKMKNNTGHISLAWRWGGR